MPLPELNSNPLLLDLFCGAGGATKGYQNAGFFVVGVDIKPQPHYCGDAFILGDALEIMRNLLMGVPVQDISGKKWHLTDFSAIHASPPCQAYTTLRAIWGKGYPELITETRDLLKMSDKLYTIENVPGAPLENALMLCGTMFGMRIIRHRLFETNPPIYFPPAPCCHDKRAAWHGRPATDNECIAMTSHFSGVALAQKVVEIDWMGQRELAQSIPPAYTEFIGHALMQVIS